MLAYCSAVSLDLAVGAMFVRRGWFNKGNTNLAVELPEFVAIQGSVVVKP